MSGRANIAGQRFGELTAVEASSTTRYGVIWRCICTCGNWVLRSVADLRYRRSMGSSQMCPACHEQHTQELAFLRWGKTSDERARKRLDRLAGAEFAFGSWVADEVLEDLVAEGGEMTEEFDPEGVDPGYYQEVCTCSMVCWSEGNG